MTNLVLQIAGFSIKLIFTKTDSEQRSIMLSNLIRERYKLYISNKDLPKIDYTISFFHEEKMKSLSANNRTSFFINLYYLKNQRQLVTFYHISLYQFELVVLHVLQHLLSQNKGFFIHSSAVEINKKAYLFLGKSGEGKSTTSQLLKKYFKIIADDGVIIKKEAQSWFLYQTPFAEKNNVEKNPGEKYLLGPMFFLRKDNLFKASTLRNKKIVLNKLLTQLYSQYEDINRQFQNLVKYVNTHEEFYELHFAKDADKLKNIVQKTYEK